MKPDQEFVETAQHFSEEAVSLYGKSRTGLLLYRVIVILSGLFFIGLILWDGFGNTGKDSHQMMLLLTFLTLALGLLLREWSMAGCTGPSRDRPGYCTITVPGGTRG